MIIKQTVGGLTMARILIVSDCEDEKVFADALSKHGRRDVYWAIDNTPTNRHKAEALGIDSSLNLVGADADHSLYTEVLGVKAVAPKPKKEKKAKKEVTLDKEIEAIVDEQSE
jgi:hypothetical protein